MRWQKLCIATYARSAVIHVDVPELLRAERSDWPPRAVARLALTQLREAGVPGLIIAHPRGIKNLPRALLQ